MSTYFTVDAEGTYREGMLLEPLDVPTALPAGTPELVVAGASELWPHGVSAHGRRHMLDLPEGDAVGDAYAEALLELARREVAPAAPSRLEGMFAFTTLEDARAFAEARRRPKSPIYAVASAQAFVGDQHWVGLGATPLVTAIYARRYWSGEAHPVGRPLWEAVIPLPVVVGERTA